MFQAAHRSPSGALNCICSLWFIWRYYERPLPRMNGMHGSMRIKFEQLIFHVVCGFNLGRNFHIRRRKSQFRSGDHPTDRPNTRKVETAKLVSMW